MENVIPSTYTDASPSAMAPLQNAIRVVLADDERLAREKLRLLLASEPGIQIVAECGDGAQAVLAIRKHQADLAILDVQMPGMDGFEVLSQLSPDEMPVVIFATAYDQYALRAFEANALDYLLKPFDRERLHNAMEKARLHLSGSQNREITRRILDLLSQIVPGMPAPAPSPGESRLVIREKGRIVFLNLDQIDWIDASANYVRLNMGKESHLVRETIGKIAERLDPNRFVRIHRSTIVDVRKIKELIPVNSGEYIVVLRNGKELSCSRGHRAALQSLVDKNF
jgi:two-component system LytT family response regulator